ncbi:hypothetical protein A2619_04490 [candidate division WWE3 bacterium RIFOXYD1_FULL_39_9]|uniref:Uncharacterized protein n=1 Tax=candidate division WWE3 bacterium RIFOXYD1_FULL_39_9 TaxID=1802649 RepID=A0A1F4X6C0_UNCKA|nr:MAG: hypothetical protein A2619_04490 [candidate division WWE3 bacterium RIFOXYD1_FULL_39_9]
MIEKNYENNYKTTAQDFVRFKKEAEYWIERFGMFDIELCIEHCQTEEDARAFATSDMESKTCCITLQKDWNATPEETEIEKIAFHEVLEILFGDLWYLANSRFTTELEMEAARHRIIRIFENCFWKQDFLKRKKGNKKT